jgi:hypothetical protein
MTRPLTAEIVQKRATDQRSVHTICRVVLDFFVALQPERRPNGVTFEN